MDLRTTGQFTAHEPTVLKVRCPACRHVGSFGGAGVKDAVSPILQRSPNGNLVTSGSKTFGLRVCPNPDCQAVLFTCISGKLKTTFPAEVIDFDATNLPRRILLSLEEAIKCHAASCYRASALMVRRTLEDLCEDKNATGKNLKDRIEALKSVAIIPTDLLTAADELRILGNDAAHIEAKDYDKIGEEESELAIELAKELLKATYQYTSLVQRLTALKKP